MSLPAVRDLCIFREILLIDFVGLDAYNALSVVDSLVSLARDYNRTVVFTIHQPRSNIVSLFDKLVLLSHGKMIYSGDTAKCHEYLENIGKPCPPGFNIADYLSASECSQFISNLKLSPQLT
jgi:ABC-type multidrug transport system ATPase subunit